MICFLFCFVLFCFVLFCFVLFCFVSFRFVSFCFVLFCFVLFCFFVCFVLWRYLQSIMYIPSYLHATSTPIGFGVGPPVEAVVGKGSATQVQDKT